MGKDKIMTNKDYKLQDVADYISRNITSMIEIRESHMDKEFTKAVLDNRIEALEGVKAQLKQSNPELIWKDEANG
jgi:hypothetical protein